MRVFLTGGTGNIGGGVLDALTGAGHDVTAAVRSDASATAIEAAGATAVRGDLGDASWVADAVGGADAVVHAAWTGDSSTDALDDAVISGVEQALAGTGRAFVFTGGTWAYGSGRDLDESSPYDPVPLIASRPAKMDRVVALSAKGIRAVVVSPPDLYGIEHSLIRTLGGAPVQDGRLLFPGSGDQLVACVHRDDIASLFLAAVEQADAQGQLFGSSERYVPMREVVAAIATQRGLGGVAPEPEEASRSRLGPLYDAWMLDQTFDLAKARRLGWEPVQPSVLEWIADS